MATPRRSPDPPDGLAEYAADRRILPSGATLLTFDADVGDHACADVLLRGDRIEAVGEALSEEVDPASVVSIDLSGTIVMPGLQDAHRHCWQGQFRRLLPSCDAATYVETTHRRLGPNYTPDDVYVGCELSAWSAVDAGITAVLDYMHNTRTLAHGAAAVAAFKDAGVRCIHASAPAVSGEWDRAWLQSVRQLVPEVASAGDLISLRLGPFGDPALDQAGHILSPELMTFARELGIGVTVDAAIGHESGEYIRGLAAAGELGPDVTILHCTAFSDEAWRAMSDTGIRAVLCPTSDAQIGLGDAIPPLQMALDHGFHPGLSIDVECSLSTNMFSQLQAIYTIQRMHAFARAAAQDPDAPRPLDVAEVLRLATIDSAHANGLDSVSGSITPGKQADLIAIDAEAINTMPLNSSVGTVVLGADSRNVCLVFVGGRLKKWNGDLVACDLDRLRDRVYDSRDRLAAQAGIAIDVLA